jgi:glutamate-5-semialdehyde dehydrogenase
MYLSSLLKKSRESVTPTALLSGPAKEAALRTVAELIAERTEDLLAANREDVLAVGKSLEGEKDKDRVKAAVNRVTLAEDDIKLMADRMQRVADLDNPVGQVIEHGERPNGMQIRRVRVPIGVLGIISELSPQTTLEILALCFKAGNVTVFRGAPEWTATHKALAGLLREAGERHHVPATAITVIDRPEKDVALELMRATRQQIDALIVRGGAGLRKAVADTSRLPVLCHDGAVNHMYIDGDVDIPMAQNLIINSKAQQPSEPSSVDTVLVQQNIARQFLPALIRRLLDEFNVDVLGCPKTVAMIGAQPLPSYRNLVPAADEDWAKQFLAPTMAVKMVKDLDEALAHIAQYGTGHTATIVSRDYAHAMRFVREVDAAAVLVNASLRLHGGEEFGLGGDVGLGSSRLHARGPISLEALTTLKYVVLGIGQLRHPHPVPTAYEDAIMLKRF